MLAGNKLDANLWWNFESVIPESCAFVWDYCHIMIPLEITRLIWIPQKSGSVVLLKPWTCHFKGANTQNLKARIVTWRTWSLDAQNSSFHSPCVQDWNCSLLQNGAVFSNTWCWVDGNNIGICFLPQGLMSLHHLMFWNFYIHVYIHTNVYDAFDLSNGLMFFFGCMETHPLTEVDCIYE